MAKYYAVRKGYQTGIFSTWKECQQQVNGFSGAEYKSFTSLQEAKNFIDPQPSIINNENGLIAYVDGSYHLARHEYGYGCVLIDQNQIIQKLKGKASDEDNVSMRNVAGEILGSQVAIQYAIDHHYPAIYIYYDYEGIEKWATGVWKANKKGTQAYQKFIEKSREKIEIAFIKVLAHSGDVYNEMADQLAKQAVGIK